MSIKFTVVGGPLDGKTFEYGIGKPSITIGRYPDCDIVFPKEMIAISRAHLTIVRENARYLLRPDETVFINGESAERDDPLPHEGEIALGKQGGQKIRFAWSEPADMPTSEFRPRLSDRNPAREARRAVELAQTSSRRFVMLAIGVAVLVVGAIAAFFLTREDSIEAKVGPLRQSVYLVITRTAHGYESGSGTAWVIAPGVLATNAHVAESLKKLTPGVRPFVRSNVPPYQAIEITSIDVHPHYQAFTAAVRDYGPSNDGEIVRILGYDVALLRVDPADAAKLAPPLRVADAASLAKLAPQNRVAYIGYPSESLAGGGVVVTAPNPQIKAGEISAVTDYFLLQTEFSRRHLVQHSLPGHGGSSGSPIFNAAGEVVALFNAGNMMQTEEGRQPSAALINFAQRADLALELLAGEAAAKTEARRRQWQQEMARFERGEVHVQKWFFARQNVAPVAPLIDAKLTFKAATLVGDVVDSAEGPVAVELPGKSRVMFLAYHTSAPGIQFEVFLPDGKSAFTESSSYRFAYETRKIDNPVKITIAVRSKNPGAGVLRVFAVPRE